MEKVHTGTYNTAMENYSQCQAEFPTSGNEAIKIRKCSTKCEFTINSSVKIIFPWWCRKDNLLLAGFSKVNVFQGLSCTEILSTYWL